jgi:protein tyrosine phosphatase (PTP) superfamily phosphohydrolase (DUF442 family)
MSCAATPRDAEDIHQVFDWLWSSGQLSEADIVCLPKLGIAAVINLAPPTSSNALPGEAELVTLGGIAYVQIPVLWDRPELYQLRQFFAALAMFEGRKVWVHCAKNMRASAFIYLYRRMVLGDEDEAAAFPLREVWEPNQIWQTFMQRALATVPASP